MPETAEVLELKVPQIRRFYTADLTEQGSWIMARLLKLFPNQNERSIIGWLNSVLDNNEFLCLYQPGCVCFAERMAPDRLSAKFVVREIFVWCEDPQDAQQQQNAAEFYPRMAEWAKFQNIEKMIICERSDVPVSLIRDKFENRLHDFKTYFVRV